jgi:hypothetical protein
VTVCEILVVEVVGAQQVSATSKTPRQTPRAATGMFQQCFLMLLRALTVLGRGLEETPTLLEVEEVVLLF